MIWIHLHILVCLNDTQAGKDFSQILIIYGHSVTETAQYNRIKVVRLREI